MSAGSAACVPTLLMASVPIGHNLRFCVLRSACATSVLGFRSAQAATVVQPEQQQQQQQDVHMSQPSQPEPELQPELPSQPDFPGPELGPGVAQESQQQLSYAQHAVSLHPSAGMEPEQHQQQLQMHMMPVVMHGLEQPAYKQEELAAQPTSGRGSRGSRATRRGPMDEMRQLVRILVKVIPQSAPQIMNSDEGGGGNRISEEQIKSFLENTLGEGPRPAWGVPQGWGGYLSGAVPGLGRQVTASAAGDSMASILRSLHVKSAWQFHHTQLLV